jgi:NADH:ubiquinone oxidoreductase subunit 6 (subunit J)
MNEIPEQYQPLSGASDDYWRTPPDHPMFAATPPLVGPPAAYRPSHAPYAHYNGPVLTSSVRSLGLALQIMLAGVSLVGVAQIVALFGRINLLQRILTNPEAIAMADATRSDQSVRRWAIIWLVAYLATAIVFSVWFFRIRKNAGAWAQDRQRRAQAWSFWAWVCPIVNFWFPFQIASDALESSRMPYSPERNGRTVLRLWWAAWLLQFPLSGISRILTTQTKTATNVIAGTRVDIIGDVALLAAGVLAILMVRQLTGLQDRKINTPDAPLAA